MTIDLVSGMLKWMMMWMVCMSRELASGVYQYKRYRYRLKDKGCILIAKPFKDHMTRKMETTLEETNLCRKNLDLITMILEQ